MRILILGTSGSVGTGLADRGGAWPRILQQEIEARQGEAPEVVHVRFFTWADGWEEHLERTLAKGPFDVAILEPTKFAFTVRSADNRVRRLLGKRAGDWFKERADAFDAKTRPGGGRPRGLNRYARLAARRVIGQEPISDVRTVAAAYLQVMARLARLEDTQVVVIGNTLASRALRRGQPTVDDLIRFFNSTLRAEAARRRFDWVAREALWSERDGDREGMYVDGLHKTAETHRRLALAVLETFASRLPAGTKSRPQPV